MKDHAAQTGATAWAVSGMTCAGCARKVQDAVAALDGVESARVSLMSERLEAELAPGTDPERVARTVRGLGYRIADTDGGHGARPAAEAAPASLPRRALRFATGDGRLVVATGLLLAAAWGARLALPGGAADWAFLAACLLGLAPIARRAATAARGRQVFTIEMLMTLAAGGALLIGAEAEAAMVIFLFAVGEQLEGLAAERARGGIRRLTELMPRTARLVDGDGLREVSADALRVGQRVLVRPGERIPADGTILDGLSDIDEAPVTGEAVPAAKGPGDGVHAGSVNTSAALTVEVTRPPEDNTIARILKLVEEAEASRAPTQRFIDRFAQVYMPAVVGFAALVAVVPPVAFGGVWSEWIYRALALLLIGCPCALVISVPASIASALSAGTRQGLLLKGGAVIEAAARTTLVAFDKTGTLTEGKPRLEDVAGLTLSEDEVLALAAGVEAGSAHPLAAAVREAAEARGLRPAPAGSASALPGRGAQAVVDGRTVYVGKPAVPEAGTPAAATHARIAEMEERGCSVAAVVRDGEYVGLLAFRDTPRADAAEGIADLRGLGVDAVMLTGDNARTAAAIGAELGIAQRAGLLPEDKVAALRDLAVQGHVTMVGDGINDAPALAAAPVGVAMGAGADVALETADGAILRNRVRDVAATIRLARAAMANIRQNVAIALGLKGVFLVTTVAGVTGLWPAILADTGATVLVTLNALRLLAAGRG